jgi:hypothetical protein
MAVGQSGLFQIAHKAGRMDATDLITCVHN